MSRASSFGARLYRGEVSYDFVGHAKRWYAISAVVLLVSLGALLVRGLHLGIEFRGGGLFQLRAPGVSVQDARDAVARAGISGQVEVQQLGSDRLRVETPELTAAQSTAAQKALADRAHVAPSDVSAQTVGPSWGRDISGKALRALLVFLVGVVIFMSVYFVWQMALAGIVALLHDLLLTIGIYALVGFEVTPSTVIGLLTILGYSLYDTVVVFDKVKENTAGLLGGSRMTYSQAANAAVNQTLVRSVNTSIVGLLPVAGLLFIGAGLLGAGTLKDLALALFVGIATGAYSSIFIATPLVAQLKERDPAMKALARRVAARRSAGGDPAAAPAGAGRPRVPAQGGTATAVGSRRSGATAVVLDADDVPSAQAASARSPSAQPPSPQPPSAQGVGDFIGDVTEDTDAGLGDGTDDAARPQRALTPGSGRPGTTGGQRSQPRRPGQARRRPGGKRKR